MIISIFNGGCIKSNNSTIIQASDDASSEYYSHPTIFGPYRIDIIGKNEGNYKYEIIRDTILLATRTNILFAFWDPGEASLFLYSFSSEQNGIPYKITLDYFINDEYYSTITNAPLPPAFALGQFYQADSHFIKGISSTNNTDIYQYNSEYIVSNLISRNNIIYFLLNEPENENIYFISLNPKYKPSNASAIKRTFLQKAPNKDIYYDSYYGPKILLSENNNWLAYYYQKDLFLYNIKQNGPLLYKQFSIIPYITDVDNKGNIYYHPFPFENPDDIMPSWDKELIFDCYQGDAIYTITPKEFTKYE